MTELTRTEDSGMKTERVNEERGDPAEIIWTEEHGAGKSRSTVYQPAGAKLLHYETDLLDGTNGCAVGHPVTVTLGFMEYGKRTAHLYRGAWGREPVRTVSTSGMTVTEVMRFRGEHIGRFNWADAEKAWRAS